MSDDVIEFYDGDKILARVTSPMVPAAGRLISIGCTTWVVTDVTYALDHSDDFPLGQRMRANIDLERVKHG